MLYPRCLLVLALSYFLSAQQGVVAPGGPESIEELGHRLLSDEISVNDEFKARIIDIFTRNINLANRIIFDLSNNLEAVRAASMLKRASYLYAHMETTKFAAIRKTIDVAKEILIHRYGTELMPGVPIRKEIFQLIRQRMQVGVMRDAYKVYLDSWLALQVLFRESHGRLFEREMTTIRDYMARILEEDLTSSYHHLTAEIIQTASHNLIGDIGQLISRVDLLIDETIAGQRCGEHYARDGGPRHIICENRLPQIVEIYVGEGLLDTIRRCNLELDETAHGRLRPNAALDPDYDTSNVNVDDHYYFK